MAFYFISEKIIVENVEFYDVRMLIEKISRGLDYCGCVDSDLKFFP